MGRCLCLGRHSWMTPMTPRIAVLLCGNLTGKAYALNGDYTKIYTRYLHETAPVLFALDLFDVVAEMAYPEEEEQYSAMVLTGSGTVPSLSVRGPTDGFTAASAYENSEWISKLSAYISRIAATQPQIKLIGTLLPCCSHPR